MKFFTPDLLERFASDDDHIALAAQEELEQRSEQYARHLRGIEAKLPPRFQEMLQRFYLHDARVMTPWPPAEEKAGRCPSLWMVLQLDTPPQEILVLQYHSVTIEELCRCRPGEEAGPFPAWLHDEAELTSEGGEPEVRHSILFSNGSELRLRFRDFDFATLKPLKAPAEREKAKVSQG